MLSINRFIEHTSLKPNLTDKEIDQLIDEAFEYQFLGICVAPFWIKKVSREIKKTGIQLVSVVGFPFGYQMTETKLEEIKMAINDGVNELDVVMNISAFKSGMAWVKKELVQCAQIIHDYDCLMKVIIETAYLSNEEIERATKICQDAGTDFVKTSTGYASEGATVEDVRLIKSCLNNTVGVKASGGISNLETALKMIDAGADRLGVSSGVHIMKEALSEVE